MATDPNRHHRKAGPGRMPFSRTANPPGTKRIKRLIKDSGGEEVAARRYLMAVQPGSKLLQR